MNFYKIIGICLILAALFLTHGVISVVLGVVGGFLIGNNSD